MSPAISAKMVPTPSSQTAYVGLTHATSIWPGSSSSNNVSITFPRYSSATIQQTIDTTAPQLSNSPILAARMTPVGPSYPNITSIPLATNISYIPPKLPPITLTANRIEQTQTFQSPLTSTNTKTDTASLVVGGVTIVLICLALFGVWTWSCRKVYKYLRNTDTIDWDTKWPMRTYRPDQGPTRDCIKDYIIVTLTILLSITMPIWGPVWWCKAQLHKRKQRRHEGNKSATDDAGLVEDDDGECFESTQPFRNDQSSTLYNKFVRIAGLSRAEQKTFTRSTKMMTLRERCRLEFEMRHANESRDLDEEAILGDDFMRVRAPIVATAADDGAAEEVVGTGGQAGDTPVTTWSPIGSAKSRSTTKNNDRAIVPISLAAIDRLTSTPVTGDDKDEVSVRAGFTKIFRLEPGQKYPNPFEDTSPASGSSGWSDCVSPRSSSEQPGRNYFAVGDDEHEENGNEVKDK